MTGIGIAAGRSWSARSASLPVLLAAALVLTAVLPRAGHASAGRSACRPTVDQVAEPPRLPLGAEVTVTLRLSLDCQAARMPLAMALVIDRSSSMLRADAIGKAREGALGLIEYLRPGADWGTLVTFNETARVDQTLTDVPALLRRAVRDLQAGGDTNISAGLAEGHKQLRRLADRSTLRALVLLTDGKNESGAAAVTREAEALRQAGIYVAAVGLGRDPERAILEAAATSPSDAWFPRIPRSCRPSSNALESVGSACRFGRPPCATAFPLTWSRAPRPCLPAARPPAAPGIGTCRLRACCRSTSACDCVPPAPAASP
ncbi:MAG: VWA domain-containing protein [Ardenticatenia bacterium]|nr:VWA domain-containing protein [Ardenticatenia bacterium]